MANKQFVTANRLTEESRDIQRKARLRTLMIGLPLAALAGTQLPVAGLVAGIVVLALALAQQRNAVIDSGAEGEDLALEILGRLPDSYTIFNQVDLPNTQSRTGVTEADLIVAGPDCLFVIEVKHNHGEIRCEDSGAEWLVEKMGRGGTAYSKTMRNPVRQVKQQSWLLTQVMKQNKQRAWVQPLVLFTHPNARLANAERCAVPVLKSAQLVEYLRTFKPAQQRPVAGSVLAFLAHLKTGHSPSGSEGQSSRRGAASEAA